MDRIFELLERKNQKATFFCLGWVAREFPHILQKINDMGFEIATHSDTHQLAYEQSKNDFKLDLETSIKSIEDIIGKKVSIYRAPGFSIKEENKWIFEELVRHGIEIDCSVFPAKRTHGGFESYGHAQPSILEIGEVTLKEFPINLFEFGNKNLIFSGGGYFRIFPYWMIQYMMKKSDYVMTYFHPRDFDPNQPVIEDLSAARKFKSYIGLNSAFKKLERLITDFEFMDIDQANKNIAWEKQKIIKL
jgi:polysaccharide deacetylase family protein (PEP-CTERM system associated)